MLADEIEELHNIIRKHFVEWLKQNQADRVESAVRPFANFKNDRTRGGLVMTFIRAINRPTLYTIAVVLGAAMIWNTVRGNPAAAVLCSIGFGIGFLVGAEAKRRPIGGINPVSPASALKDESVASKQSAA